MASFNELFERAVEYPDFEMKERLDLLVGLDDQKERLVKILSLLVNPYGLEQWAKKYHPRADRILNVVLRRPPLIVLEGDVGSGKSELATTIGDAVARHEGIDITLLPLSLSTRGQGHVGEITKLLSDAFDYTYSKAEKLKGESGKARGGIILLVDEADALAQSREGNQMHHEDKAGVNAFIRGIDRIANGKLPAAIIMCTNRIGSLDPAVKRRAAEILSFNRPNPEQRRAVISPFLKELELDQGTIDEIVSITGSNPSREYGFTFSDLTQRLLPSYILGSYPDSKVSKTRVTEISRHIKPTPPFNEHLR